MGGLQVLTNEKEWVDGEYYIGTAVGTYNTVNGKLVGIPLNWQNNFNDFFDSFVEDIDNDLTYIQHTTCYN